MAKSAMEFMRTYADIVRDAQEKGIKEAEEKEVGFYNKHTGNTDKAREVKGKLYGSQEQLDTNGDGNIEADDLAALRKSKKAKK